MSNPYNNEVIFNGQTLMSLKEDTITPNKVLAGETFHDRSGAPQTGSLITHDVYDGLDSTSTSDALSANQGRILNSKLTLNNVTNFQVIEDSGNNLIILRGNYTGTNNFLQIICNSNSKQIQIAKSVDGVENVLATFIDETVINSNFRLKYKTVSLATCTMNSSGYYDNRSNIPSPPSGMYMFNASISSINANSKEDMPLIQSNGMYIFGEPNKTYQNVTVRYLYARADEME